MSVLTLDIERVTVNQPGIIEPNEKGEYRIIVGGLNIYSPNGFYYKYTPKVEKILTSGSFKIKLDAKKVYSEDDHPDFSLYSSEAAIVDRMTKIDMNNTVGGVINIEVVKSKETDPIFGEPVYYIVASIIPHGPHKDKMIKLFADPNIDICFSVRSFSDKYEKNGVTIKEQKSFVTWDMVTDPGHYVAKKSFTNSKLDIESVYENEFTGLEIKNIRGKLLDKLNSDLDLESTNAVNELLGVFDICPEGNTCIYENWQ